MIDTINKINKEVALQMGINEDLVKKVNKFYWERGVKDAIREGDITNIRVRGLGTICTSRYKLRRDIEKKIRKIRRIEQSDKVYVSKTKEQIIEEHLVELRRFLFRRNEIAEAFYAKELRIREYKRNNICYEETEDEFEEED